MSDRDPEIGTAATDWAATRALNARTILRDMVDLVARKTTHLAPAPMPLPKGVYIDEERFQAEREHLFLGEPVVAGLTGDIPEAGDVLVFDAAGPSILVMRGKDGVARAFLNMCTHRGAKLIEEAEPFATHRSRLTCPFHAWTFDSKGALVAQPSNSTKSSDMLLGTAAVTPCRSAASVSARSPRAAVGSVASMRVA